jgi:hypothetical protein
MRVELLQRLADLLRKDAANPEGVQFDLGTWAAPSDQAPDRMVASRTAATNELGWSEHVGKVPVSCSTRACALGLAAISGAFKKEGLTYVIDGTTLFPKLVRSGEVGLVGFECFTAAQVLFAITDIAAIYLFDSTSYPTCPKGEAGEIQVAERIEAFIEGRIEERFFCR